MTLITTRYIFLLVLLMHVNVVSSLLSPIIIAGEKSTSIFAEPTPASRDYIDRDSYWVYMYYLLMVYRDRTGDCNVQYRHTENGWKLGMWLAKQRESKKNGRLDSTYEERLEEAGVIWDPCSKKWDDMFNLLAQFKDRNGDCDVPQHHYEDGELLGTWLMIQRTKWRKGKLLKTRQMRLEELGVVWNVQTNKWDQMYSLLLCFKSREGHCLVPIKHKEEGQSLGSWLSTQRKSHRAKTLVRERQNQLEKIGVVWNVHDQQWDQLFVLLCRFMDREGHAQIPINHKEGGKNLGHWFAKQRQLYRTGCLDENRHQRLSDAGVVF